MINYVIRRLFAVLLLVIGISMIVFLMIRLIPGNPATAMLGENAGSTELVKQIDHQLGLDEPIPVQYVQWAGRALTGNLGYSYQQREPVASLIARDFPYTFELAVISLSLALLIGTVMGTIAALNRHSIIDTVVVGVATTGFSIPSFWLGILLLTLFGVTLRWFPVFSGTSINGLVLPVVTLSISGAGFLARFVRSNIITARQSQHVTTARSKGITRAQVLVRHVIRNSMMPVLTVSGLQFGHLLAGAVIVETVFSRPGIGSLLVQAILAKDYPTVEGVVLLIATLYALVNLGVDLLYPLLDRRITVR